MGDRISITNKAVVMSDAVIKEKIIHDLARAEDLSVLELEKLVNLDGLEKYLVLSLGFEQHNLLNIGNLWKFTQLTKLQLANNLIEEIEGLELLSNLQFLDLSFNSIKYIKGLESLLRLTYLNLSSNKIEVLENMESLKELETFLVRYNKMSFENIYFLTQFEKLLNLGVGENPFGLESDVRLRIIAILPQLKILDFVIVTESELRTAFKKYPANIEDSIYIKAKAKSTAKSKINIASTFKISSSKPAFIEELANGQGFEVLLKSDKNFYLLHSFPPASNISSKYPSIHIR